MRKLSAIGLLSLGIYCFILNPAYSREKGEGGLYEGQVVVTPRMQAEPLKTSAHSVQVVDGEQLKERVDKDVAQGLRELPGVVVETLGTRGETTNIKIRGATGADTLVLLDGVRLNNPATNETNLSLIPIELIERVEILQGSQATLYGGSAVGGVINILTREGTPDQEVRMSFEMGNFGRKRGLLTWTGEKGPVRYSLGVSGTGENGQFLNDGFNEAAITQRWDIAATKKTKVTVTSRFLLSEKEFARGFLIGPAPLYDPMLPLEAFFLQLTPDFNRVFNRLITTQALRVVHTWNPMFRMEFLYGFFLEDTQEDDSNIGDPGSFTPAGVLLAPNSVLNKIKAYRNSAELRQYFLIPEMGPVKQSVLAAFEFYDERVKTFGEPFPGDPPPPAGSLGPFIPPLQQIPGPGVPGDRQNYAPFFLYSLQYQDILFLDGGFRWDNNSAYGNELSPRAAFAVWVNKISGKFHGAYGEGFLPPTIIQLFNPITGNPNLQPQKSQSYEVGYEQYIKDKATLFATFFYLDFDNIIDRLGTNTDDAFATGVEAGFQVRPIPQLIFGANYTFTHSKDESGGGQPLERTPAHLLGATLSATPWRTLKIDTVFTFVSDQRERFPIVSTSGQFVGGTPAASLEGGTNPGYARWDMAISYVFELLGQAHPQSLRLYGKVNNILNAQYEEVFGFPAPGINFFGGAEVLF